MTQLRYIILATSTVLLGLAALFGVQRAQAVEFIADEDVTLEGAITENIYATGSTITVESDATIEGDFIGAAETIIVDGTVEGDIIAAASEVIINGQIEDARIAGYRLALSEGAQVSGEVVGVGYSYEQSAEAAIGTDLVFAGAQAVVHDVTRNVWLAAGAVEFNGEIGGDARVDLGNTSEQSTVDPATFTVGNPEFDLPETERVPIGLTLTEDARVGGDLTYTADRRFDIGTDSVAGSLNYEQLTEQDMADTQPSQPVPQAVRFVGGILGSFLMLTVVGAVIQRAAPEFLERTLHAMRNRTLASFGVGFAGYGVVLVLVLVATIVFFALAIPLSTIGAASRVSGALFYLTSGVTIAFGFITGWLAVIAVGLLLGQVTMGIINPDEHAPFWALVVGLAIVTILLAIPILGTFFLSFLISIFGLGAVVIALWPRGEELEPVTGPAADTAPSSA